ETHSGQPRRIQAALKRLSDVRERLYLKELVEDFGPATVPLSLHSTIALSDEQLLDEQARQSLYRLSILPPKPNSFSEEVALTVAGCDLGTIDQLVYTGLLESSGEGYYTLHQSIHAYAWSHLGEQEKEERYAFLVDYVNALVERSPDACLLQQEIPI